MGVIPVLERLMVEDREFKANVGHAVAEAPDNRMINSVAVEILQPFPDRDIAQGGIQAFVFSRNLLNTGRR